LREPPGKYRLLVLHSPGNREEFWYNSTFHKLKNSTRGRGSDDSGVAPRGSNRATLQMHKLWFVAALRQAKAYRTSN
jgi:hypothetical protein